MKCEQIQPDLLDYSRGTLPTCIAADIRDHLEICKECAAMLKEESALDAMFKSVPTEEPSGDVWNIVQSRISTSKPGLLHRLHVMTSNKMFRITGAIAVTAALLAIFTIQFRPAARTPVDYIASNQRLNNANVAINWTDDPAGDSSDAMLKYIEKM